MQQVALNTVLPIIKRSIRDLAVGLGTNKINTEEIGRDVITGRQFAGMFRWPIADALKFFESEGAIKCFKDHFEIINGDYFNVDLKNLNVPIGYSIDQRIEKNLLIMTGLYGQLFDLENRIRFFLTTKLERKHGKDFLANLTKKVRESIIKEKAKTRIFITDARIAELEFSNFSDLILIIQNESDFISNGNDHIVLIERMQHLNEVRTAIGHHNLLVPEEITRIKDNCLTIKKILENN